MHRVQLADERPRPVAEHVGDRHVVRDAESEVEVGEAIPGVHRQRAHGGSGDDALVLLREPQETLAQSITLLDGEHEPRL